MESNDKGNDSGSFATGFTLGLFAGAAGLYLFGTKDGKKLTKKLSNEWENAKSAVLHEAGLETTISLKEMAQQAKDKIMMVLDGMGQSSSKKTGTGQTNATGKSTATGKPAKRSRTKSKSKFKGV